MENRQQQENNDNNGQQQERQISPAAAIAIHTMTAAEKAKYFGVTGLMTLIPAEVIGMGGTGLLVALAAGGLAAYWSEEVRDLIIDKLPTPKHATSRNSKLEWLFTGRTSGMAIQQPKDGSEDLHTEKLPDTIEGVFPQYVERDTLRLGRVLATGQRFDPHFNSLVGQGMIMAAVQGAGKSQLTGRTIEQAGKCGMPLMALDHKGEYDTITELPYVNGYRAGAMSEFDFQLTADNARELVEQMMVNRYQVMVNLPSYGTSWLARAEVVAAIGKALMEYAAEQKQRRMKLLPCLVLLDEAQLYIPQDVSLLPPEAQENKKVLSDLKNSFFALVSNGRSYGYTMCFATQSLTYIAKWAIKSCQIQVFLRHAEKNALDMCEDIIDASVATREEIRTFEPGVGVVIGFTRDPMVVKFDKKESRDESETPTIERLRESAQSLVDLPAAVTIPMSSNGQTVTLTYADLMRLMNENTVSQPLSNVSTMTGVSTIDGNALETSSQAGQDRVITDVFPVSKPEPIAPRLSVEFENEVPEWKRKQVQAMKEAGYPDRDIAALVKLTGRKYKLYQECLIYLGYKQQEVR